MQKRRTKLLASAIAPLLGALLVFDPAAAENIAVGNYGS
jgi:hypothetical protein